jgi:hypothetical protein
MEEEDGTDGDGPQALDIGPEVGPRTPVRHDRRRRCDGAPG